MYTHRIHTYLKFRSACQGSSVLHVLCTRGKTWSRVNIFLMCVYVGMVICIPAHANDLKSMRLKHRPNTSNPTLNHRSVWYHIPNHENSIPKSQATAPKPMLSNQGSNSKCIHICIYAHTYTHTHVYVYIYYIYI